MSKISLVFVFCLFVCFDENMMVLSHLRHQSIIANLFSTEKLHYFEKDDCSKGEPSALRKLLRMSAFSPC